LGKEKERNLVSTEKTPICPMCGNPGPEYQEYVSVHVDLPFVENMEIIAYVEPLVIDKTTDRRAVNGKEEKILKHLCRSCIRKIATQIAETTDEIEK
jgi:hypothetical protein